MFVSPQLIAGNLITAAPSSMEQLSGACAVTMQKFSTLPQLLSSGKIMVKILFAVLLLQPPTCLANPFSRSVDLAADESGTPKIL